MQELLWLAILMEVEIGKTGSLHGRDYQFWRGVTDEILETDQPRAGGNLSLKQ